MDRDFLPRHDLDAIAPVDDAIVRAFAVPWASFEEEQETARELALLAQVAQHVDVDRTDHAAIADRLEHGL